MSFYAVAKGRQVGVFESWAECEAAIKGFKGAVFKKFAVRKQAEDFIGQHSESPTDGPACSSPRADHDMASLRLLRATSSALAQSRTWPLLRLEAAIHGIRTDLRLLKEDVGVRFNQYAPSFSAIDDQLFQLLGLIRLPGEEWDDQPRTAPDRQELDGEPASKKARIAVGQAGFSVDVNGYVQVYTDGACENNGKAVAKAGIGVWWGAHHPLNLSEPVQGSKATNNTAEIQAVIRAIELAKENGIDKLHILTDSNFVLKSVNDKSYMAKWKTNGWVTSKNEPVKNKEDFQRLDRVMQQAKISLLWSHVKGHCGNIGNEAADELARLGALKFRPAC